ncbi:MAG: hypothetical protein GWN81_26780 [Phycisphaerae bacterium]|nr:hypothetical protein [Phycisphaerae bacterium]
MNSPKLNEWLQVIGIFAVVASLIFVGIQLIQSQNIANADRFQQSISARAAINDSISENASIIAKANNGEDLTESEYLKLSRTLDSIWAQGFFGRQSALLVGGPSQGPEAGLAIFLFENPGVRKIWGEIYKERQQNWAVVFRPDSPLHESIRRVNEHLADLDSQAN